MPYTERVTAEYFTQIGSQLNILPDRSQMNAFTQRALYKDMVTSESFIQRSSQLGPLYREAHSWVLYTERLIAGSSIHIGS